LRKICGNKQALKNGGDITLLVLEGQYHVTDMCRPIELLGIFAIVLQFSLSVCNVLSEIDMVLPSDGPATVIPLHLELEQMFFFQLPLEGTGTFRHLPPPPIMNAHKLLIV
jgi:hypothetical protein